jgi:phosphate transport system ATP-binding protein
VEALKASHGRELVLEDLCVRYSDREVVHGISLGFPLGRVSAIVGPSGCGKTTLLRALNRLVELTPLAHVNGRIVLDGNDLRVAEATEIRRRIGMVFQRPNPFPMTVFDNVAYALRHQGSRRPRRRTLAGAVERALVRAGLWEEVKDDLHRSALRLSGGQQQRLCIARALAAEPEVILLDEPCSSLDPRATATIEALILELRSQLIVVVVTHNLAQAKRTSDLLTFILDGRLVETGETAQIFGQPREEATAAYLAGAFG